MDPAARSAAARSRCAYHRRRASRAVDRGVDRLLRSVRGGLGDHRTDIGPLGGGASYDERIGARRQPFDERGVNLLVHQHSLRADAQLPRVSERTLGDCAYGEAEIGIGVDDVGEGAAELDDRRPHAGRRSHGASGIDRAGEADPGHAWVFGQLLADLSATADEVDPAQFESCFLQDRDHRGGASGCQLRRLEDDGASGGDRGRDLVRELADR